MYNFSYPLAIFITTGGFLTCGHLTLGHGPKSSISPFFDPAQWTLRDFLLLPITIPLWIMHYFVIPRLVLDLSSLSRRGNFKIAHDGAFVHPNGGPSTTPDSSLLREMLEYASTARDVAGKPRGGMGLIDIARFHALRVQSVSNNPPSSTSPKHGISNLHMQIIQGECALTWETLRGHQCRDSDVEDHDRQKCMLKGRIDGFIPTSRLEQWFGEERLPDGWWDVGGVRPRKPVGLLRTRVTANFIGTLARKSSGPYQQICEGS